jgi:uncharacterized iron-regulated protein
MTLSFLRGVYGRPMRIAAFCLLLACAAPRGIWQSPLHRDHPLAGRIWDGKQFVEQQALEAGVQSAHFVLLGETHDNPDHHALQARLVRAASRGRRPAIVFEMLDVGQQPVIDAAPRTADAMAQAVDWAHGGWPDFSLYRPVFEAALEAGLPVVAGNFTRKQITAIVMEGAGKIPAEVSALLQSEGEEPEARARAAREEMRAEHCGQLPDSMLAPMAMAQRARDAQLALRMAADAGSILIAGSGHVRADRGVPVHLAVLAPGRSAVSVAFVEVAPGKDLPEAYAATFSAERLPFDFAVFTPAAQREDPCKALEKRLKRPRPLAAAPHS